MSNFKVGDVVMWSTANHWSKTRDYQKSKIISETKTEFKTENGKRIFKKNNYVRGYDSRIAEIFDIDKFNKDIEIRKGINMTNYIYNTFSKYIEKLNFEEIEKLYLEIKEKIKKYEDKQTESK